MILIGGLTKQCRSDFVWLTSFMKKGDLVQLYHSKPDPGENQDGWRYDIMQMRNRVVQEAVDSVLM